MSVSLIPGAVPSGLRPSVATNVQDRSVWERHFPAVLPVQYTLPRNVQPTPRPQRNAEIRRLRKSALNTHAITVVKDTTGKGLELSCVSCKRKRGILGAMLSATSSMGKRSIQHSSGLICRWIIITNTIHIQR